MQTGFLSETRRAGASEPTGMRSVSVASRHYREEMPQAGHLDLADLHSLAQPGVRGAIQGYGGHSRGDRGRDNMQQGLASMIPQTGAMRPGFGTPSHFLGSAAGSLEEYSAQNPNPHHAADYMMRGKASHNPYYRGSSSHGHGYICVLLSPVCACFECSPAHGALFAAGERFSAPFGRMGHVPARRLANASAICP
jgi:hypothetical protein